MKTVDTYLAVWREWIGYSESNGKYKEIIDIYNGDMPLPRNYKIKYSDEWCDVTVSSAAIKANMIDIIGKECGCEEHIRIFKEKGIWIEDGNIKPLPGYIIVYNWNDNVQPNDGYADHIAVVEKVIGNDIICIEGNYKNAVSRRVIPIGYGYIRGYAIPKYDCISIKSNTKDIIIQNDELSKQTKWKGKVSVNTYLNVRKWAGLNYKTCTFSPLYNNDEVEVCDQIYDSNEELWYYIRYKEKYGFVHSAYIIKNE